MMKSMKNTLTAVACALSLVATTPAVVNMVAPVKAEAFTYSTANVDSFFLKTSTGEATMSYKVKTPSSGILLVKHKNTGKVVYSRTVTNGSNGKTSFKLPSYGVYNVEFKSSSAHAVKYQNIQVSVVAKKGVIV